MAIKAFPHEEWLDSTDPKVVNPIRNPGMDLRDYFAAKAMQGLAAHVTGPSAKHGESPPKSHARVAYEYADAMMEARNGNQ
jgi:hypothetical protein